MKSVIFIHYILYILCPKNSSKMKKTTGSVSRTFKTIYLETITQFICKKVRIIKAISSR